MKFTEALLEAITLHEENLRMDKLSNEAIIRSLEPFKHILNDESLKKEDSILRSYKLNIDSKPIEIKYVSSHNSGMDNPYVSKIIMLGMERFINCDDIMEKSHINATILVETWKRENEYGTSYIIPERGDGKFNSNLWYKEKKSIDDTEFGDDIDEECDRLSRLDSRKIKLEIDYTTRRIGMIYFEKAALEEGDLDQLISHFNLDNFNKV